MGFRPALCFAWFVLRSLVFFTRKSGTLIFLSRRRGGVGFICCVLGYAAVIVYGGAYR